jgi:hypothetical protein
MLTPKSGAILAFGTTIFGKLYMSFRHRIVGALKGAKAGDAHLNEKHTQEDIRTQLNEAEYAPLICATLLYMGSQNIDAPLATTLAVLGNTGYLLMRFTFGIRVWTTTPFASMRYTGMFLLMKALYDNL